MSCEGALKILEIKRHDTLPRAKGILSQSNPDNPGNPTPVNLTGATINFIMVTDDDVRTVKVNAAATITDALAGEFEYIWTGTDTDTSGEYLAEFEITFPLSGKISLPADDTFKIRIRDDYDNA